MSATTSRPLTPPDQVPDPVAALLASPPDLPVVAALLRIRATLATAPTLVVTAPPGTGKTTLVPTLVADLLAHPATGTDMGTGHTGTHRATPTAVPSRPLRVVVTQPRRVAARAAARRLASLMGQEVGNTVGYAVRGEHHSSADTRIEVVTAGLLLRRLQADPALEGVGAVILDEAHERSLDTDLLLALLLDARAALREDLRVVAMSATLDAERLAALLNTPTLGTTDIPAPVVDVPGAAHPIDEVWAPPPPRTSRLGPRGVPPEFLAHIATTTLRALREHDGDALVFLPGAREVDDVVTRLRHTLTDTNIADIPTTVGTMGRFPAPSADRTTGSVGPAVPSHHPSTDAVDVLPLHGRLSATAQDAALAPSPRGRRRVVVSTNVAESSLTVPGVRIVVDSTLAREPRVDVARGMSGLVTVGVSQASGTQRAGRAGREGPGAVYRCATPSDWARSPSSPTPEILAADLTELSLELACWGVPDGEGLAWMDAPPAPAMARAREVLVGLGLVAADGAVTPLGRAVESVPADVRPARALLAAAPVLGARQAAEAVALLTMDLRAPGGDLAALARQVRDGGAGAGLWRAEVRRLERAARRAEMSYHAELPAAPVGEHRSHLFRSTAFAGADAPLSASAALGVVVGMARPEWVARRRSPTSASSGDSAGRSGARPGPRRWIPYVTAAGTGVTVPASSPLADAEWLAVADADRSPGCSDALVRAAAVLDESDALTLAAHLLHTREQVTWAEGRLRALTLRSLGAIELSATPAPAPGPSQVAAAVVEHVREAGDLSLLSWSDDARELTARLALLHTHLGEPWPDVSVAALLDRAEEWLGPAVVDLAGAASSTRGFDLGRLGAAALRTLLPWPAAARLDELVPERLAVPSGSHVRLSYAQPDGEALERPVLAVRVQECFGWEATPRVVDGQVGVLLHLLSPARRPVAVTDDLASFWEQGYPQVRAELRGRYPKHAWPEDPWNAPAVRGTGRRRRTRAG